MTTTGWGGGRGNRDVRARRALLAAARGLVGCSRASLLVGAASLCLNAGCREIAGFERSSAGAARDAGGDARAELPEDEGPPASPAAAGATPAATSEPVSEPEPEAAPAPAPPSEPAAPPGLVGAACTQDADCSQAPPFPLICVTNQANGFPGITASGSTLQPVGGPAGGYCSRACGGDGECGVGARCLNHSSGAFCYAGCDRAQREAQCVGGGPQACAATDDGAGSACYPLCQSHEQCGAGRFCDPSSGLCVAQRREAAGGVGAPCSVTTQEDDCQSGLCLYDLGTGEGICTALCRSGETSCGAAGGEPALGSVCLSYDVSPGAVGWCAPLCDTGADCSSGAICRLGSPVAGRPGICDLPIPP